MSNFDFLKGFDDDLWKCGTRIEKQIHDYPFGVQSDSTAFLEHILKKLRQSVGLKKSRKNFYNRLDEVYRLNPEKVPYNYKTLIYKAYQQRNKIHADLSDIEKDQYVIALDLHKKLYFIAKKYFEILGGETDELKGFPPYKAPELDFSPDELELLEIPDFNELIEFNYDYCVICGEPNHSNYSIYCEKCNREIEYANNFISIRNSFGKDNTFTKEDLIEYGIHEGYVQPLINFLSKNDLFKVKGRLIEFNNLNIDSYLKKIDNYIKIGELITAFRENKITPTQIKQSKEYIQGSFKQEPFYQFFKVINEEIMNKFENELTNTENIWNSIEYTKISQKDLKRWYLIRLNQYKKNNIHKSFIIFNKLLIEEYLSLKRQGIKDKKIKSQLNITKEMFEFFPIIYPEFNDEVYEIKKGLILKLLSENKSRAQILELTGINEKEYIDIINYSKFKENEFSIEYEKIVNKRKEQILTYLTVNNLKKSCKLTKINEKDFYQWFDDAKIESTFYIKSNKILMDKYLNERREGKTKSEACKSIGLKESIVDMWLKRKNKLFDEFKDKNLKVIVDLILNGFKQGKTKEEIASEVEISVRKINNYISLGRRGSKIYAELSMYYEENIIPQQLSKFLEEIKNKPLNKSLENVELTKEDLDRYYENNKEFHDKYLSFKKEKYVKEIINERNHETAINRSNLSHEEYYQLKEEIDEIILKEKMEIVKKEIMNDKVTEAAAKQANVTVDDIYEWYHKGKNDEAFKEFSEFLYKHYIDPNITRINNLINKGKAIDRILKLFDINFTEKDFEIWQKEGLIEKENIIVNLTKENKKDNENEFFSLYKSHKKLYSKEFNKNKLKLKEGSNSELYNSLKDKNTTRDILFQKEHSKSASILKKDEKTIENLKKEIMRNENE